MLDTYKEMREKKFLISDTGSGAQVSPPRLITVSGAGTIQIKQEKRFCGNEGLTRNYT